MTHDESHESKVTIDHGEIQEWVEERDGWPASVEETAAKDDPGLLRICFPGHGESDALKKITWDEFFEKFDEKKLVFLYQEKTADGGTSRFNRIVDRETAIEHENR